MTVQRAFTRLRAPDEQSAEDRSWEVARAAYRARQPAIRRRPYRQRVVALAAGIVLVGGLALSPAGAAVGRLITRVLGIHDAAPALFSLPAPGRLLVSGPGGTWAVAADGSTRRLGPWSHASWSPHGLYVTVAGADQLAAVDLRGTPRWTLARPHVRDPRWYPPTGYRVAYLSGPNLRVVAGDGTGDHLLAARVAPVAPAWRPAYPYQLAYVTDQARLVVRDANTGQVLWSSNPGAPIDRLTWSANGQRLLALSPTAVRVYTANGALAGTLALPSGAPATGAALSPDSHTLALILGGRTSEVVVENIDLHHPTLRRVLAGAGLGQAEWSPDGKWLLVSWPAADQWVFVRIAGQPRITAVSHIAHQFSTGAQHGFPRLDGWCCTTEGPAG